MRDNIQKPLTALLNALAIDSDNHVARLNSLLAASHNFDHGLPLRRPDHNVRKTSKFAPQLWDEERMRVVRLGCQVRNGKKIIVPCAGRLKISNCTAQHSAP